MRRDSAANLCNLLILLALTVIPAMGSAAGPGPAEAMEPLEIKLPEESFSGTPLEYWSVHLEEYDFRDREPYLAPKGTTVVSKGKPVTSSYPDPLVGELKQITDGDKHFEKTSVVELGTGVQWVQVDLEKRHDIYAILLWHFHEGSRVYFDVVVQVSNDPTFEEKVRTLHNNDFDNSAGLGKGEDNEYVESYQGRLVKVPRGIAARHLRCYSNGCSHNKRNHYVEVEVWGKPAEEETDEELEPIKIEYPEQFFGGMPL